MMNCPPDIFVTISANVSSSLLPRHVEHTDQCICNMSRILQMKIQEGCSPVSFLLALIRSEFRFWKKLITSQTLRQVQPE